MCNDGICVGCVTKESEIDSLKTQNRRLRAENARLEGELEVLRHEHEATVASMRPDPEALEADEVILDHPELPFVDLTDKRLAGTH